MRRGDRLTAERLNAIAPAPALDATRSRDAVPGMFLARITGWTVKSGNVHRWRYSWSEVVIDGEDDQTPASYARGDSDDTHTYGLNICELNNTNADDVMGSGVDTSDTDATVEIAPVGNGSGGVVDHEVVVPAWYVPSASTRSGRRMVFWYPNAATVTCS
jgi:hypothetical protein